MRTLELPLYLLIPFVPLLSATVAETKPAEEPTGDSNASGSPRWGTLRIALISLCWLAFVLIVAVTTYHHEPWRDEADAWLVARDASVLTLFKMTGHMGTPPLWYLLLMPAAKLGLPYGSMYVINILLISIAAGLLLWRAPFPLPARIIIITSYPLLYEYGVIARPYALTVCLLFLTASLWEHRHRRAIPFAVSVGLLAMTTVFGLFFAATIGALYLFDAWQVGRLTRRDSSSVAPLVIMLALGLFSVGSLIPIGPTQLPTWTTITWPEARYIAMKEMFGGKSGFLVLGELLNSLEEFFYESPLLRTTGLPLLFARGVLMLTVLGWIGRPRLLFLLLLPLAGMIYVFEFKWYGGPRHAVMALMYLVFCYWIWFIERSNASRERRWLREIRNALSKASHVAFAILLGGCVASAINAYNAISADIRFDYSHSTQMARHLRQHGYTDAEKWDIAADFWAESVLIQIPDRKHFWYSDLQMDGSYNTWDFNYFQSSQMMPKTLAERVNAHFIDRSRLLMLLHGKLLRPEELGFRLLYATDGPVGPSGEVFYLYRATPDTGEDAGLQQNLKD